MGLAYIVLFLLPILAIGYIVWDHKRKRARREAAAAGRIEEILAVATQPTPPEAAEVATPASPHIEAATSPAAQSSGACAPASYAMRERLLSPPQTLLYYLLRTSLADHNVFAQTPVAAVLEPGAGLAAYAREEQARIFARHVVDFVVTDKSTRPVAVLKLITSGDASQGDLSLMRTWFAAVGVRYVELDPAALPRKEAMRAVVLGEPHAPQTSASDVARAS